MIRRIPPGGGEAPAMQGFASLGAGAWGIFHGHVLVDAGSDARLLHDNDCLKLIEGSTDLGAALRPLNGGFWGAVYTGQKLQLFCDRFGTYPLFYRTSPDGPRFGDDLLELARDGGGALNVAAALCLAGMEFVPGSNTLAAGIEQVGPGEIVELALDGKPTIQKKRYWRLTLQPESSTGVQALEDELGGVLRSVGEDWSTALLRELSPGGKIAVPLSGGLDSRLLLAMFRPHLGDRLVALCYGDPSSLDVEYSRLAARSIGLEHRQCAFTDASFVMGSRRAELVRHVGGTTRFTLADGGLALAEEFGEGTGDVEIFLPGHSGDGISGSRLKDFSTNAYENALKAQRSCFPYAVSSTILKPGASQPSVSADFDAQDAQEAVQRWTMEELVYRRVNPELVMYRRRHAAYLPFFDTRIADFFSRVPRQCLYSQRVYVSAAAHHLFTGEMAPLGDVPLQGGRGTPWQFAADPSRRRSTLPRRIFNRALRTVDPVGYERRQVSCPMMALWKTDRELRDSFWREVESSRILPEIFDRDKLLSYLRERAGRDYNLTTLGMWNLLTVELFGREMREVGEPSAIEKP